MKVLIVDDNEQNRYMLETLLRGEGHEVLSARDGVEALDLLKSSGAALIISDILMPRMDGFQLCRAVRNDARFKDVPFVIYTATYISDKDRDFALSLGADRFLVKPDEIELLGQTIKEVLAKKTSRVEPHPLGDEMEFFRQYNEILFRKLEKKVADLEAARQELQEQLLERNQREAERALLEEQLRQAQKMEAIGQLAGGVAHDFNNMLSAIVGYCTLAALNMKPDDPSRHYLEQILASADRASTLTQSLLAFSRKQAVNLERIDLNEAVSSFEKFLIRLLRENIELRLAIAEAELPVTADRGQIEQVLMNLIANARDAIREDGRIIIETSAAEIDDQFVRTHGFGQPDRYALLTVSDTGSGIPEDILSKIFDPFFTTKEEGKGTGLGLSMVFGIVKTHRGYIDVYSRKGMGTTFKIYLPIAQTPAKQAEKKVAEPPPLLGGTETILIAEDDDALRNVEVAALSRYGYTVIEAVDGVDAVARFTENRDRIRLVILDGIMPKMSGKEASEKIRALGPGTKVIFISGYADDTFSRAGISHKGETFLRKPISTSMLARKIRNMLDE
ncbi:MAG: hypothetical protein CVU57_22305 [Deltaproteobacteria bacterium HGW-Deltaproteobacteria-15]|jgi:signal transduction histidine kinase|nr:MAG: hypothetical protein CVU57_22305 [Deltaproteobacteria bacterium HGW-Deltaproteobacteria-15]